jgi:hypothetical protein
VLLQRVSLRRFLGDSAYGPVWAYPVDGIPARIVGKRRAVRTREGTDVISDATCDLRPVHKGQPIGEIPAESGIIDGTRTYRVLGVADIEDLTRRHGVQLLLEGPQ